MKDKKSIGETGKRHQVEQASGGRLLWIAFAQIALLFLMASSAASSNSKPSERENIEQSPKPPTIEVGGAITSLIDYLQVAKSGGPRDSEIDSLKKRWQKIATTIASDTTLKDSGIGKIIIREIQSISLILDYHNDGSDFDFEEAKQELNAALETLHGLIRMAGAAHDSLHTALLVVSSVACECETQRCIRMLTLYDSLFCNKEQDDLQDHISANISNGKEARLQEWRSTVAQVATRLNNKSRISENRSAAILDFFQTQAIEDVFGTLEIPSWLLFDHEGNLAMLVGGSSNPGDAAETLTSWLGKTLEIGLKKDKPREENSSKEGTASQIKGLEGGDEDGKRRR